MPEKQQLPHFIIGGAPRSGTTFLAKALERHPGVYMAKPFIPEPKVLIGPNTAASDPLARYAELFKEATPGCILGEKTSYYLECRESCDLIAARLPSVKMVFIVREPVARAFSNYLWSRQNGLEKLSFAESLSLGEGREDGLDAQKSYVRPFAYLSRGDYAAFARRYYQALGRERVGFFLYEDLLQRPAELMHKLQVFIGLEPQDFADLDVGVVNSSKKGPGLPRELEAKLRRKMLPLVNDFAETTGLDLTPWGYDALRAAG